MMKHALIVSVLILLFLPITVYADGVDVSRATSYYIQGGHDVIVYNRLTPLAYMNIRWCTIYTDSSVQLTAGYLCDSDKILIYGQALRHLLTQIFNNYILESCVN